MKKLSKLLALSLALNFLVPAYASASSEGQDEMKKISEVSKEGLYPLSYTPEFFDPYNKALCTEALNGNDEALIKYAQSMRIGYEMASCNEDKENQIWYVNQISAVCKTLKEKLDFDRVIKFLYKFSFNNPPYANPTTKDEKNRYQACFESPCGKLTIGFSASYEFYEIKFEN